MDAEEEASESEAVEKESSVEEFGSGITGIAYASTPTSSLFFDNDDSNDEAPPFCLMAKTFKGTNSRSRKNSS